MAIIRKMIYENEPLTPEQIEEIERLDAMPITFDEDCPELDVEQLKSCLSSRNNKEQNAENNY